MDFNKSKLKTLFKKEDTGLPYDEEFSYEETKYVPLCWNCLFYHNNSQVAPCIDCEGLHNTGKSYFKRR